MILNYDNIIVKDSSNTSLNFTITQNESEIDSDGKLLAKIFVLNFDESLSGEEEYTIIVSKNISNYCGNNKH